MTWILWYSVSWHKALTNNSNSMFPLSLNTQRKETRMIYDCILGSGYIQPSNFSIFLLWQIKYWGNYMKMHFTRVFPRQCFCRCWQDFILRASAYTSATLAKTSVRSKLVRLLPLLHISPRIRSIMCTIIVVQILLYIYCYIQCHVLFSHVKNCFKNTFRRFIEFKSKDKYERKMLNRLTRNSKRKIYISSFCLILQVLFFFSAGRWTNGKRMKQNKSCLKMWHYRISPIRGYMT